MHCWSADLLRPLPPIELLWQTGAPGTGRTVIDELRGGDVIVVEQRTGVDAGSWGGILTLGAKVRGIAGVIADGPVRDIDEARAYDFRIYCRALTGRAPRAGRVARPRRTSRSRSATSRVAAGDFVIADASGVAFIPAAEIERVLDAARAIAVAGGDGWRRCSPAHPSPCGWAPAHELMLR